MTQKTLSAGGVIVNPRGEVALVKNDLSISWWGFPKGHIDPGEDALTAAKREIAEETGLTDLRLIRALPLYERYKGSVNGDDLSELKSIQMFLFTTDSVADLVPNDPHNPEARWVPLGEIRELLTHPKDKEFFDLIRDSLLSS